MIPAAGAGGQVEDGVRGRNVSRGTGLVPPLSSCRKDWMLERGVLGTCRE